MNILFNSENASIDSEASNILDTLKLNSRMWRHNDKIYQIIRYDKPYLTFDRIKTSGLFRSVIFRNGNIVVFSPPKGIDSCKFEEEYDAKDCIAQEYVEGTMINVFYDTENCEWEIATRSSIGGKMVFFTSGSVSDKDTFRSMFMEACAHNNLDFNDLCKEHNYSFVLQHPNNRIVIPFKIIKIYLVAVYDIDNNDKTIKSIPLKNISHLFDKSTVDYPMNYEFTNFQELKDKYASGNTDYKTVGVMLYHLKSGVRSKFRNPNYEMVRKLKGNQPKKQYTYLLLRNQGKVSEYLKYYSEDKKIFSSFRDQIHGFTNQLQQNYLSCYVRKEKALKYFPHEYRGHMFTLHQDYLIHLRPKKKHIAREYVINYINNLHPSKLMYSLNYHLRQMNKDEAYEFVEKEQI